MRTLSVITCFFAIAVHATGAYALAGLNGLSTNGLSSNCTIAAMPSAPIGTRC